MTESCDAPRIFTPEYYRRMRELEEASWWNAGMRDVADELLQRAALPETGTMLDVGCGSGQTMDWFQRARPGWRTMGLDVAPEGLTAARSFGVSTVMRASALRLPLPTECMDLVISLDVLQHLPLDGGDRSALAEFARVLKPGGALFLRTNAQAFPRTSDDRKFDFHRYEVSELEQRLRDAGFRVLRVSRINALLGLAEIPRELRARSQPDSYHGIMAAPPAAGRWPARLKRRWLRSEGHVIGRGLRLPFGRTIVALAVRPRT